ncbi:MAG: DUF2934 domain-containing protein [Nitrospira sp. CR1.1]|jgi:hypothetical protein|nr:DUF2934 domain-containing protein [Nitrospira sp. CR1.1]
MKPKMKLSSAVTATSPRTGRPPANAIELPDGMWDRISQKAYELWKERGSRDGYALQDWLDAEVAVMEEVHEARE